MCTHASVCEWSVEDSVCPCDDLQLLGTEAALLPLSPHPVPVDLCVCVLVLLPPLQAVSLV